MLLFTENKNNKIKDKENLILKEILTRKLVPIFKTKMHCLVEFPACVSKSGDDSLKTWFACHWHDPYIIVHST